jgi:Bacterial type III secretion protein (HrpB1_HrpK)
MSSTPDRDQVAGILFDIFSLGTEKETSKSLIPLLNFLRAVRPKLVDAVVVLAWELMKNRCFKEARVLLEETEFEHPGHAGIKATLASVLYFSKDASWQTYVTEVRRLRYDEEASLIVDALEAAADAGLDPVTSFFAFQSRSRLVDVIKLNHPELLTE